MQRFGPHVRPSARFVADGESPPRIRRTEGSQQRLVWTGNAHRNDQEIPQGTQGEYRGVTSAFVETFKLL